MNLIIKNCTIINEQNLLQKVNIVIEDGLINKIDTDKIGYYDKSYEKELDGSNLFLFPGFIDFHAHLFKHGSTFGIDSDTMFSSGITTVVDMGTAGWANYPAFHECDIKNKKMRIKSFLNVSPIGQPGKGVTEPLEVELIDEEKIKDIIQRYNKEIIGLKIRYSKSIIKNLGLAPLKKTIKIGERLGLPLCVHVTDPAIEISNIAKLLRKGDIFSHVFHNKGQNILEDSGRIYDEIIRAKERGVIFDLGNGRNNFDFDIAEKSMSLGFKPDILSSDSTSGTYQKDKSMWDISYVMSKFLLLGMSLNEVIDSVTVTPAKILKIDNKLGKLKVGYIADLTLCEIVTEESEFLDSNNNIRIGKKIIRPVFTIKNGEIVYNSLKSNQV